MSVALTELSPLKMFPDMDVSSDGGWGRGGHDGEGLQYSDFILEAIGNQRWYKSRREMPSCQAENRLGEIQVSLGDQA